MGGGQNLFLCCLHLISLLHHSSCSHFLLCSHSKYLKSAWVCVSDRWLWHVYVNVLLVSFQLSASVYICPSAFYCLFVPSLYMIVSLQFQWFWWWAELFVHHLCYLLSLSSIPSNLKLGCSALLTASFLPHTFHPTTNSPFFYVNYHWGTIANNTYTIIGCSLHDFSSSLKICFHLGVFLFVVALFLSLYIYIHSNIFTILRSWRMFHLSFHES